MDLYKRRLSPIGDSWTTDCYVAPNNVTVPQTLTTGDIILDMETVVEEDSHSQFGRWMKVFSFTHRRTVWIREGWWIRDFVELRDE